MGVRYEPRVKCPRCGSVNIRARMVQPVELVVSGVNNAGQLTFLLPTGLFEQVDLENQMEKNEQFKTMVRCKQCENVWPFVPRPL